MRVLFNLVCLACFSTKEKSKKKSTHQRTTFYVSFSPFNSKLWCSKLRFRSAIVRCIKAALSALVPVVVMLVVEQKSVFRPFIDVKWSRSLQQDLNLQWFCVAMNSALPVLYAFRRCCFSCSAKKKHGFKLQIYKHNFTNLYKTFNGIVASFKLN